ncbi:MAG: hypothetical protein FH748_13645 [Balneolaceae bacterium]|nr:hypothetical protein [Balneolaceae bacterium]
MTNKNIISIIFLMVLLVVLLSCSSDNDTLIVFEDSSQKLSEWDNYLSQLGKIDRTNKTIVLFVRSIDCEVYKSEIKWWDKKFEYNNEYEVVLVILEKYKRYYKASLNDLNVKIFSLQDKNHLVLDNNLIYSIPSKVFLDRSNKEIVLSSMGTQESINNFLEYLYPDSLSPNPSR